MLYNIKKDYNIMILLENAQAELDELENTLNIIKECL